MPSILLAKPSRTVKLTTLEKVLHLRRVPLFSEMGGRELRQVAEIATEESFASGEVIFHEGDVGAKLYIVVDGSVDIFLRRDKKRTVLANIEPGGFFGEMSMFDNQPRSAGASASDASMCLTISADNFRELVYTFPSVVFPILQNISKNLRRANQGKVEDDDEG